MKCVYCQNQLISSIDNDEIDAGIPEQSHNYRCSSCKIRFLYDDDQKTILRQTYPYESGYVKGYSIDLIREDLMVDYFNTICVLFHSECAYSLIEVR